MKENRDYSGKTERIIEEEYDKKTKAIDDKLSIDRRIKQTNNARRKQVAIQKSVMIAAFAVLTTLGAKQVYNINKGEEMIANDFHSNVTSDIGCGNYTDNRNFGFGYHFFVRGTDFHSDVGNQTTYQTGKAKLVLCKDRTVL